MAVYKADHTPIPNSKGPGVWKGVELNLSLRLTLQGSLDLMMNCIYKGMEFTQNVIKELEERVNRIWSRS